MLSLEGWYSDINNFTENNLSWYLKQPRIDKLKEYFKKEKSDSGILWIWFWGLDGQRQPNIFLTLCMMIAEHDI